VLAAAATRTERIRLSSGVTVLGSEDPIRVYQQFATIDQISRGRAEVMAGRGSFIESFPLFGQDLGQYDDIFAEKLDLLLNVRDNLVVTHAGAHRPSIDAREVYPRAFQEQLPVWLAIGGTPQSAVRAADLGLPLALAIIGGEFRHFEPMTRLYRKAWAEFGHDPAALQLGINAHGFVGETTREAQDLVYPTYQAMMNQIGRERGWQPRGRDDYDHECAPGGALLIGSVDDVVESKWAPIRTGQWFAVEEGVMVPVNESGWLNLEAMLEAAGEKRQDVTRPTGSVWGSFYLGRTK
jgi:alkanesulfonate monooxygenase SsuD/methylene tetrahydromethanopterin reductase-like flavin-dependent oxidoreductase (luciferase family)